MGEFKTGRFRNRFHVFLRRYFRIVSIAPRSRTAAAILVVLFFSTLLPSVFNRSPDVARAASIVYEGTTTASTTGATSLSINKPSGVITDDVLVAVIAVEGATGGTISATGWTSSGVKSSHGATNVAVESFYRRIDGSEGASFTFNITSGSTRIAGSISSYRGVATSGNPIEATSTSSSCSSGCPNTTLTQNAITPTTSQSKIIGIYAGSSLAPVSFTPPTTDGIFEIADVGTNNTGGSVNDVSLLVTDYSQAAAGSFTPGSATASGSVNWAGHQISLKPTSVSNMILFWDGTDETGAPLSLPSGWSIVTEANGRFIRGESAANYGGLGGNSGHTPTANTPTVNTATGDLDTGTGANVSASNHSHTTSINSISNANNLPAYCNLRLIRYDGGIPNTIPRGAIAIFDGSPGIPASGWTRRSSHDGRFVRSDITTTNDCSGGSIGGSDTHNHSISWNGTGAASGTAQIASLLASINTSSTTHTHTAPANTSTDPTGGDDADPCDVASDSCRPPYVNILLAKANADTSVLSIGLTSMFDGAPGGGWVVRSDSGGPYYQRFMRGSSTYQESLGTSTHLHGSSGSITSGATGQASAAGSQTRNLLGTGIIRNTHTHTYTVTMNSVDHTPQYYNVVVAEKVNFIFNHYAWYDDNDALKPLSRYSSLDIADDSHILAIPTAYNPPDAGNELRLRIQILVNNSDLADNEMQFKLQFKEDTSTSLSTTTCTSGTWTDVGNNGEGTVWTYAVSSVTDGLQLSSGGQTSVFSPASSSLQRYAKSKTPGKNIGAVSAGQTMEFDYHIMHNGALGATQYRFRLVEDSGILLSQYGYGAGPTPVCPTLTTKPQPMNQLRHGNFFDNTGNERGYSWVD